MSYKSIASRYVLAAERHDNSMITRQGAAAAVDYGNDEQGEYTKVIEAACAHNNNNSQQTIFNGVILLRGDTLSMATGSTNNDEAEDEKMRTLILER